MKSCDFHDTALIDDDWPEMEEVVVRPVRRYLSLISLILMLGASGADLASKGQFSKGIRTSAMSNAHISRGNEYADLGMDEWALAEFDRAAELREDLQLLYDRGGRLGQAGMVIFVFAFGCFGLSRCVGERAFSVWFLVLSIHYVFLFMLMV